MGSHCSDPAWLRSQRRADLSCQVPRRCRHSSAGHLGGFCQLVFSCGLLPPSAFIYSFYPVGSGPQTPFRWLDLW